MRKIFLILAVCCMFIGIKRIDAGSYDTRVDIDWLSNVYANRKVGGLNYYNQVGLIYANGVLSYCLESTKFITEDTYHSTSNFSSKLNNTQKEYISLLAHYGYGYPNHLSKEYYMATQELIWEYLEGIDVYFTTESKGNGSIINIDSYKQEIINLVNTHNIYPSFKDKTLTYKEGAYISSADLNGVIDRYETVENYDGFKLDSKGFSFHTKGYGTYTFRLKLKEHNQVAFLYYNGDSQTIGSFSLSNNKEFSFKIILEPMAHKLKLQKIDKYTKEPIKQDGISFKIKKEDGTYINDGEAYITNQDGYILTNNLLPGTYIIEEIKTPNGYYGIPEMKVTININTSLVDNYFYLEYGNVPFKSKIKIKKEGLSLISYKDNKFNYVNKNLEGIEFDVYALEDISAGYYTYYKKGDIVEHLVTNSEGISYSKELPYGTYCIKETKTLNQYKLDDECRKVILDKPEGTEIEYSNVDIFNERVKTKLTIKKVGEELKVKDNLFYYEEKVLENIEFNLYALEDIIEDNKVIIKKDELINTYKTNNEGVIEINDLPYGKYYLKETVPNIFEDQDNKYEFVFDENNINHEIKVNNYLKKGSLLITKVDAETNTPLENVKFGLYNLNDELIYYGFTNNKGELFIDNIAYGNYYVKEIESLSNYINNDKKFMVEINDITKKVELKITNKKIEYPNTDTTIKTSFFKTILVFFISVFVLKRYV